MSDNASSFTVWGFIKGFGKLMIGMLLLLQGLIGLVVLLLVVGVLVSVTSGIAGNDDQVSVTIPDGAALTLDLNGVLVEQAEDVDPFQVLIEEAYGVNNPMQIEVHDVVRVIRNAATDDRIKGLVLDIGALRAPSSSASKLHYIADEIAAFKESGKKVVAVGDYYDQSQYLLAAHADEVYLNDYGNVVLVGYGRYGTYVKSLLEKLKVTSHVFRVGTFKSAIEPFTRDDMSPEAKAANAAYLEVLWREYVTRVETARGLAPGSLDLYTNNLGDVLEAVDGDLGEAALKTGLVDGLKSRYQQRKLLAELFGKSRDGNSYKNVGFKRYLTSIEALKDGDAPNVAVITAAGAIIDGEAPAGQAAGGDTIAAKLRKAREDDNVKAVVLRVDSPGGSAFASDIMRDELLAIKEAGKPVVASMGSLAASGGYWISAGADEIWAAPTTITGSIGIFGYFNTFENTAAEIGVYTDGVGTTALSPFLATGVGPLPASAADIMQRSIENGYDRFLSVVSEGRGVEKAYVDSIGQGRVWIGERAKALRLVDKLGDFDDAVASAAALAGLEDYDVVTMEEETTPFDRFLGAMSVKAVAMVRGDEGGTGALRGNSAVSRIVGEARRQVEFLEQFNDPNAAYARCIACE